MATTRYLPGAGTRRTGENHSIGFLPLTPGRPEVVGSIGRSVTPLSQSAQWMHERAGLSRVFDALVDMFCILDAQGRILSVNEEWYDTLGYRGSDLTGRDISGIVHPDDRSVLTSALGTPADAPIPAFRARCQARNGDCRWFEWRAMRHGEVVFASLRDVTSCHVASEQLRYTESRYRAVVNDQTEFIVRWLPDGTRTFVNDAYARYFGQSPEELIGASFMPLIGSEEARQLIRERISMLTPDAPIMTNEHRALRADGQLRWQEWVDRGLFDANGTLVELQSVGRDIHDRVVAEQELNAHRTLLRILVEDTPAAVAMFDKDMRYLAWSRRWLTDYRMPERDITGLSHYEVFPEISDEWKSIHRRCLSGITERRDEDPFVRLDGSIDYVRWVCQPWYTSGDQREIGGIILFTEVVTDRRHAREALRRSEEERQRLEAQVLQSQKLEAIGRLSAGVAHDFNNLLTVVTGYSDLLLNDSRLDSDTRELVGEISAAGLRASRLTSQLLAFSRQQVMREEVVNLEVLVANISRMLARVIGEDVLLVTKTEPGLWPITADSGQIEQVLMNLTVNARDAMPQGGQLTIDCRNQTVPEGADGHDGLVPGAWVKLEFRDTGHGMDANTLEHLFEPFFTTKEQGRGTGLGLATVYGIMQQSGGVIRVSSEPGKGSLFELYFRAAIESPNAALREGQIDDVRGTEGVLVVEDDDAVRFMIESALRRFGYTVYAAASPDAALRALAALPNDVRLLITDVVMPGMNGRELAERVASQRPEIGVLFVSGYNDDAVLRRGIVHGDVDILSKPFTPSVLATKVREILSRS